MSVSLSSSFFSSPWPDPNSPVLSKIGFGVPLVELLKWLDVRDTFLGDNCKKQDIANALALARDCKHPDAEWLTSIFEGKEVATKEDAREVLLLREDDARALCFAWWLTDDREDDLTFLLLASEMGNAFACSTLWEYVWEGKKEESFRLARLAASQRERDGFYELGDCFRFGVGCEENLEAAKENYLIAAELGYVSAAGKYGDLLGESDPVCWLWHSRAALHGSPYLFLGLFSRQVNQFFSGSGIGKIVFLIGNALNGNVDADKKRIFGQSYSFNALIHPANQALSFYDSQIKSARLAVDTWTLVSTRLNLIKDMRVYIGKMIWEGRFEANYDFDLVDASSYSSFLASLSSASFF